jgi:hypothetical protein
VLPSGTDGAASIQISPSMKGWNSHLLSIRMEKFSFMCHKVFINPYSVSTIYHALLALWSLTSNC